MTDRVELQDDSLRSDVGSDPESFVAKGYEQEHETGSCERVDDSLDELLSIEIQDTWSGLRLPESIRRSRIRTVLHLSHPR